MYVIYLQLHAVEGEGRLIATACNGEFAYARLRGRDKVSKLTSDRLHATGDDG